MARLRFSFWLDTDKDDELLLMEDIDALKRGRVFTKTIRDGIRLMMDLRRGNLDVLLELFPDLRKRLKTDDGGPGSDDLKAIRRQLDQLQQVALQTSTPGGLVAAAREHQGGGPQDLNMPSFDLPRIADDDDDFADLLQPVESKRQVDVAGNFLKGLQGL